MVVQVSGVHGSSTREHVMDTLAHCLHDVVRRPSAAAEHLLSEACRCVHALDGRLLLLSAKTGDLEMVAERLGSSADITRTPWQTRPSLDYPTDTEIARRDDCSMLTVPAVEDGLVVAALELRVRSVDDNGLDLLVTIAGLLPLVRSNITFRDGLQLIPPIPDVSGDESSFRRRVSEYLDAHTRAALVCVYLVDPDLDVSLVFAPVGTRDLTSLQSESTYELIREVALGSERHLLVERQPADGEPAPHIFTHVLFSCPATTGVVRSPGDVAESYVMLVGFPMRYQPCEAEIGVLKQLLVLAAYLHQVYSYVHEIADRVGHVAEVGSAITGLEVSQKARHDAKNQIELGQNLIAQFADRPSRAKEFLEELGLLLRRVADDLDEMKRATKAPERERVPTSLREIWDTACAQVRWRMSKRRIRLSYDGADATVLAAPDWFRQVFLNLLLNSADAFDAADRRSGRIVLRVTSSQDSDRVEMTYSDDATGILPQHFLTCDVATEIDLPERVFLPGVTSKSGGSGWGLYVCRSIVRAHLGSIDLDRSKSGTVFKISIPRARGRHEHHS